VPAPWRSILLTPNILGKDGVSALSREMARALPTPTLIISLHDRPVHAEMSPVGLEVRGARGSRMACFSAALVAARQAGSDATVACSHLHLAPIAKILTIVAGRGARLMVVLCGIEAWVPIRLLERWALRTSDVAAISLHTATRFKAANPKLQSVTVTLCYPGLPAASAAAPRHGPSAIALIVARMSASERYKGHDALLDVWPRVLARHPDAVLAIAGDGDDRPRLEEKSRELGLERAVTFIGRIPDNALAGLYARSRFFVMPSRDEGFGLVFLEAMRAAKPCIGGVGAASEIIEEGVTGFIVDPGDRETLLATMLRLYGDDAECARLGAAGRERFLSQFTDRQFQSRFNRIIAHDSPSGKTPLAAAPVS
jgi:phosphatidylinositol alpha-1,6-mannosyltransferase